MSLRENLVRESVKTLCMLEPVELGPDGTVSRAIALMREHAVGCVVVTRRRRPIGMFTERDVLTQVLARKLAPDTPVADVMTENPEVIDEASSVADVIRAMHAGGFRHMPVVDPDGSLIGVASVKRIVDYLVEHFPSTVFNLPPEPGQKQFSREGA